ncbi:MAG: InlB B-repeat-containing protein, partial [Clostridiales bacterium]|nr:InlB B-repeat-containing protein [Clostridiales bacterium]
MKKLRLVTAVLLTLCFVLSVMPATAAGTKKLDKAEETEPVRTVYPGNVVIDDNSSGGYEGDYVVIYNPALSSSTSYSTGTMTGLIETSISPNVVGVQGERSRSVIPENSWKIDIDSQLDELARKENPDYGKVVAGNENAVKASYSVGDTKTFTLVNVNTNATYTQKFKVLYVGQHCYIWTPSSSSNNTYPLDQINSNYAQMAATEFDSKFDLMQSSFGNHTNGSSGDGKLSILYYNIDDGWDGSGGYIGGFFYQGDITSNGLPILNIDTYPGITYNGYSSMDNTYNTMVHEYQHLINYSNTNGMNSWMNECWSAAAEEICYPGSSIVSRIQSYENYFYSSDWQNPPKEFQYNPTACPNLHQGYSMYGWSNDLSDVLALYGQVSLFAQYLFSRFGNTIYKTISGKYSSSETTAITNGTGVNCADLVRQFRVALTANTAAGVLGDLYHFKTQDDYDPASYNNVENPYSLLGPIVFTGTSCSIKGGGAITVKPVNGVYNPPSGANSNLKYIGVKFVHDAITSVSLEDISVKCGGINTAKLTVLPEGTVDYTVTYTSAAPGIFTVDSNGTITGVAPGAGTLSAVVHDNTANTDYNVSCTVTVENFHGYVMTDSVEVGEKYIIVAGGSIDGTTGYAAGNTTVSGYSCYLNPVAVTIVDGSAVAYDSSIDFDAITWIPAGSASAGYTWQNVGNSKYIGLDSNEIVCPSTTSTKWLYDSNKYFNSQTGDYPYLSFAMGDSSRPTRYTSSTGGSLIHLFKYVEPTVTYTVTAVSNNTNYGTVSVSGTIITATPAAGYYVESAEVISGTASVSVNGNTITVSPSSDCTVRVNFAPKPTYTLNFVASGTAVGSQTAYAQDTITLPTTVSVNPDGWTFIGWAEQQTNGETEIEPTYYAPGASYTVNGNATLYALYTRVDGEGDDVYQLVDSLENGGQYIIVDQAAISGTTGYAVGNSIVANNHYLNAV